MRTCTLALLCILGVSYAIPAPQFGVLPAALTSGLSSLSGSGGGGGPNGGSQSGSAQQGGTASAPAPASQNNTARAFPPTKRATSSPIEARQFHNADYGGRPPSGSYINPGLGGGPHSNTVTTPDSLSSPFKSNSAGRQERQRRNHARSLSAFSRSSHASQLHKHHYEDRLNTRAQISKVPAGGETTGRIIKIRGIANSAYDHFARSSRKANEEERERQGRAVGISPAEEDCSEQA